MVCTRIQELANMYIPGVDFLYDCSSAKVIEIALSKRKTFTFRPTFLHEFEAKMLGERRHHQFQLTRNRPLLACQPTPQPYTAKTAHINAVILLFSFSTLCNLEGSRQSVNSSFSSHFPSFHPSLKPWRMYNWSIVELPISEKQKYRKLVCFQQCHIDKLSTTFSSFLHFFTYQLFM